MNKDTSIVVTSIAPPNAVLHSIASGALENNSGFIVVGDTKSPSDFSITGCRFISIQEQKKLSWKLARLLPEKHYARKNLGYLEAKDSQIIVETDDDNFPGHGFWKNRDKEITCEKLEGTGWVNVYRRFTRLNIWPRGFPLEKIFPENHTDSGNAGIQYCPVQQGLADDNPDVDAVYRMTLPLPVCFEQSRPLALGKGAWCPFNSQNTTWFKEAFILMYLPSYCSFRMTDIWRSFIAQRIAWTCGWSILFHSPTVRQERNEHNLLKDFEEEIPGYLNNALLCKQLEELDLREGPVHLAENLFRCYRMMVNKQYISENELLLVESWISDISGGK